jgi:15-cis-phytoene desaturase
MMMINLLLSIALLSVGLFGKGTQRTNAFSLRTIYRSPPHNIHMLYASSSRRPTPSRIKDTKNFKEAQKLSQKFLNDFDLQTENGDKGKRVAIFGGGLSGLACAKYLSDAGHNPTLYEARPILGGKVAAWQDADGDYIETGLHIFFGAYPNIHNLFEELKITDRLQWAPHRMTFAMQELPGEFTSFEFPAGVPAPFNMAAAILGNTKMLTLEEKIRMVPGLLPMLLEGQSFIDAQDELSVLEFMVKYGMPERINEEIFVSDDTAIFLIADIVNRKTARLTNLCYT